MAFTVLGMVLGDQDRQMVSSTGVHASNGAMYLQSTTGLQGAGERKRLAVQIQVWTLVGR